MASEPKRLRGRPRSTAAVSHDVILDAVFELLHHKSVRNLTIEEIARQANVGKPTIYKWWPTKAALVIEMFEQRIVGTLAAPEATTAEQAIRTQVTELIRLLNGFFGKVAADLIAEGQADPAVLQEYRDRYVSKRRAFTREWIVRAQANGEFLKKISPDLLIDMIYGPIYYRLLVGHQPLDQKFGKELVDHVIAYLKSR